MTALTLKQYQRNTLEVLTSYLRACRSGNAASAYATALVAQQRSREPDYHDEFNGVPCVCLRIPTGGGKTLLAAHAIAQAAKTLNDSDAPVALWLTPSDTIRSQTLQALNTPGHPYRAALETYFPQRVRVCELDQLQTVGPQDVGRMAIVIVATIQSFRVANTTQRNVYSFFEDLAPHFEGLPPQVLQRLEKVEAKDLEAQPYLTTGDLGRVKTSVANWLALHRPIVIVDEAHNNRTHNSFETLKRLSPSCIVEMTATPVKGSNVLYHVSAQELRAEEMIKLPIVLAEHPTGWRDAVRDAVLTRQRLELAAQKEPDYIRPIVLFQAAPRGSGDESAMIDGLRAYLIEHEQIPAAQIAVATGSQKELDGIHLADPACVIRFVITVEALKEGWDCPFAYVLCSLQEVRSAKDVEQLLGRVLRMPYARNRVQPELNQAYAHVVALSFSEAAAQLADRMVENMGFEAFEAATVIQPSLPLQGGEDAAPLSLLPDLSLSVSVAPVLDHLPAPLRERVDVRATSLGATVIVRGELSEADEAVLLTVIQASVPKKEHAAIEERIATHRARQQAVQAPSERDVAFAAIPQLCLELEGHWQAVERETLTDLGEWDLLGTPVSLAGFAVTETAHTFQIDMQERRIVINTSDVRQLALNDVTSLVTETDLVRWLDREVRQPDVNQTVMLKYLGLLMQHLQHERNFTLTALLRSQFQLAEAIRDEIERLRKDAQAQGFQKCLAGMRAVPTQVQQARDLYGAQQASASFPSTFSFRPGFYPARPPYYRGRYLFKRHYYPVIHDLRDQSEEWRCALAIDSQAQIKHWVRNISQQAKTSFWLPTATDYFYPDFVCELMDGRILVVEYKGEPYKTNDDSREKMQVGDQWEKTSGGRCLFLMAVAHDGQGRDTARQIAEKILLR